MRRAAAEHQRRLDPAGDGEVGASTGARMTRPNLQHAAGSYVEHLSDRDALAVDPHLEIGTSHRSDDGGVGPERRSEQRHFQTGGGIVVAHEQIRLAQRPRVHGAGDRHAQRLMSPAAEVLHGGEQSRTHDGEGGGRRHTR